MCIFVKDSKGLVDVGFFTLLILNVNVPVPSLIVVKVATNLFPKVLHYISEIPFTALH